MRTRNFKKSLLSFLIILTALTFSKISAASEFITPDEVHEGMVGYGKTVFHGTKIETFKVTVLGVLKKAVADTDLILVKIDSPYLKKNKIGLVAGMSGSPVYFNGKLAGAVAYGWPFTETPLAGITPIHAMLQSEIENKSANSVGSIRINKIPSSIKKYLPVESQSGPISLMPLGVSISASGFDAEGISKLQTLFPMLSVVPGGSMRTEPETSVIEAGQSVGAALVDGDFNLVATGTMTYRNGLKILAFGHPFLSLGDVNIPLFVNYVHYILPSLQLPFKFASPAEEIGNISEDRLYGIGGNLGVQASMVPMTIHLSDPERGLTHQFNVRLAKHPQFTSHLAALVLEQAVSSMTKAAGDSTATLDYTLYFKGLTPLHLHNLVFSDQSISGAVTAEVLKTMSKVLDNDFERVTLEKITVNASITSDVSAATIQKLVLSKHHLNPGEPLEVSIFLKPYNGAVVKKDYTIHLPSDLQGTIDVGVAGGTSDDQLRRTIQQQFPDPLNVGQVLRNIQDTPPNNALIIRLGFPRRGIQWAGENFGNLPAPYADLLKAAGTSPLSQTNDGTSYLYDMPWVVLGTETEQVTVGTKEGESPSSHNKSTHKTPSEFPIPPSIDELPPPKEPHAVDSIFSLPSLTDDILDKKSGSSDSESPETRTLGTLKDWQEGTLHHLAISSHGNLFLAPKMTTTAKFEENVLWSFASGQNAHFVGTANPGKIYKIDSHGDKTLFFDPHSIAVLSLDALPNGDLLAGTTGGKLLWLSGGGNLKEEWHMSEHYIWQIYSSGKDVYIATGNPQGKIYRFNSESTHPAPELYYASSQSHILSLCAIGGKLYAGTANDGLLLDVGTNKEAKTIYDFDDAAVPALAKGENGSLIIGTGGEKGKVYLRDASGKVEPIAVLPDATITWLGASGKKILAATAIPGRLYALQEGKEPALLWDGKSDERVGLKGNDEGSLFYTSGNHPILFRLSTTPSDQGEFLSKVIDTQNVAQWGHTVWHGDLPPGTGINVQSRSGNSAEPDATWSDWSAPYPAGRQETASPKGRYLQYRVILSKNESAAKSPKLQTLQLFWRSENIPPSIKVTEPDSGEAIGPEKPIQVKVSDKDSDTVRVEAFRLHDKLPEKFFSKLVPISKGDESVEVSLDKLHDQGTMDVRLVVSDSPSRGEANAYSTETVLKNVTFDSVPPTLKLEKVEKNNNRFVVKGTAKDKETYVKTVQFKLDDGPWLDTVPEKGIFDYAETGFSFEIDDTADLKEIEIRVLDAADNESDLKKSLEKLAAGDEATAKPKEEKKKKSSSEDEDKKTKSSEKKTDTKSKKDDTAPDKTDKPKTNDKKDLSDDSQKS